MTVEFQFDIVVVEFHFDVVSKYQIAVAGVLCDRRTDIGEMSPLRRRMSV